MNWCSEEEQALYESLDDYTNRVSLQLDESQRREALVTAIANLIDTRVRHAVRQLRSELEKAASLPGSDPGHMDNLPDADADADKERG